MRERLIHKVSVRLSSSDYNRLIAVGGKDPIWLRAAIRSHIRVCECLTHKVNSEIRGDPNRPDPGAPESAEIEEEGAILMVRD